MQGIDDREEGVAGLPASGLKQLFWCLTVFTKNLLNVNIIPPVAKNCCLKVIMLQKNMAKMLNQEVRYIVHFSPQFTPHLALKRLETCPSTLLKSVSVDVRVGRGSDTRLFASTSTSFHGYVAECMKKRGPAFEMRNDLHSSAQSEGRLEAPQAEPAGPIEAPRVWEGLATWRSSGVCENRIWGLFGPDSPASDNAEDRCYTNSAIGTTKEALRRVAESAGAPPAGTLWERRVHGAAVCSAAGMPPGMAQPIGEDREPSGGANYGADVATEFQQLLYVGDDVAEAVSLPPSLAECGRMVLLTSDPKTKAELTHSIFKLWAEGKLPLGTASAPDQPARPSKPELVPASCILNPQSG